MYKSLSPLSLPRQCSQGPRRGSRVTVQWQTGRCDAVLRVLPSSCRPSPGLALWRCAWSPWSLPPVEAAVRCHVTTGGHLWCLVLITWYGPVSRFKSAQPHKEERNKHTRSKHSQGRSGFTWFQPKQSHDQNWTNHNCTTFLHVL